MPEIVKETAPTEKECMTKLHTKYGMRFQPMEVKHIREGGFLGIGARNMVQITGVLSSYVPEAPRGKPGDFEEEKRKLLAAAGRDPTLQQVLTELRSVKEQMEAVSANTQATAQAAVQAAGGGEHPTLGRLEEILVQNDFTPAYRKDILERARREFSLEALEDYDAVQDQVVEWIGDSITIYREPKQFRFPRILVLVGPTGVGKTTTIAKLAAMFGTDLAGRRAQPVRLITIDKYRIGASAQIETYGGIMGIPVSSIEHFNDLRETIALYSEGVDIILIDTIGRSPRAAVELGEMKELLDACGSTAEFHLVFPATTKSSDIVEILKQFEPFGYRSVLVTKMDETIRLGNVISALAERGKAVSYITNGQHVPYDLQRANRVQFLINLEGFRINRPKIEERFPSDTSDSIQWRKK